MRVRGAERAGDLFEELERALGGHGAGVDQLGERRSVDVSHRHEPLSRPLAGFEDGDDVRVVKGGEQGLLLAEGGRLVGFD
jgi:hypothetical protein